MVDKTYEVCPHCGEEVEIDAELKVQVCPICGHHIVTCSMCTSECSSNCCLEKLAHQLDEEKANKCQEKITSFIKSHNGAITFPDNAVEYFGGNGRGYLNGISINEKTHLLDFGYEVNGFLFVESFDSIPTEICFYLSKYLEEHKDDIKCPREYNIIMYLDADISECVTAYDEEDAVRIILEKFRHMSDEEFLKHIGYFRNITTLRVWDSDGKEVKTESSLIL